MHTQQSSQPETGSAQPEHTNRLARETSPYLLQHAHNPVEWWPWGHEAFEEARRRDVPIFLSIGYSTCYWCHVMERESFESEAIAAQMNEQFLCVKVDREERPDVDNIYMAATQIFTGRGGWPMSVFLEPQNLRPFWAGTYFPPEPRQGMNIPTFPQVLEGMHGAWVNQREGVLKQAEQLAESVKEHLAGASAPVPVGQREIERAADELLRSFDQVHGGFGAAPKFPQTSYIDFLLDAREQAAEAATRDAIDRALKGTLDAIAIGGIRDHVGGGFHRYSVDTTWTVPHFEKMLYDQALLALVYIRAARIYDDAEYKRVVRETLEYVLREMTGPEGGFFSAQDAEVNSREGENYLWTPTQLAEVLDPGEAEFAARVYGLEGGPNFQDPHHPEDQPTNVLRFAARPVELAARLNMTRDEFLMKLASVNRDLYTARMRREQPRLDDKTIAEWNGLMISAFAEGAMLFEDDRYFAAADTASKFVLERMTDPNGRIQRSYRDGRSSSPGVLEDSSMMIMGLLSLHRAAVTRSPIPSPTPWLESAIELYTLAIEDFRGLDMGFHDTREDREDLFVRSRTTYDGAIPCGSSVMLNNLIDLADATGDSQYLDQAVALLRTMSSALSTGPVGSCNSTRALLRLLRSDLSARDPDVFAAADAAQEEPCPESPEASPVEIYSEVDSVELGAEQPAELILLVRIADGYHVTAADPGLTDESGQAIGLMPFHVHVIGGGGVAAYADYPAGDTHGIAGQEFNAYDEQFELRVALELAGELVGVPKLAITYQACTDTECLMPRTVELDVEIKAK